MESKRLAMQQPLNKVWRILKKHGDSMKCQSSSSDRRSSGVEGLLEREQSRLRRKQKKKEKSGRTKRWTSHVAKEGKREFFRV